MIIPEQVPCLQAPCPVPRVECQPSKNDEKNVILASTIRLSFLLGNPDQSVNADGGEYIRLEPIKLSSWLNLSRH